jgi:hypothetical protein
MDLVPVSGPEELHRSVVRAVVHEDHFEIAKILGEYGVQAFFEKVTPVPVQDDDREKGCGRLWFQG